jgi:polyketide cyclase/dehydrase/lipid transport protein
MKWVWIALGAVAALVALMALVGSLLPRDHHAVRSARFRQPVDVVWAVVADPLGSASWRGLRSVERLPDREGRLVWKELDRRGDALMLELVEDDPPRRRVVRIADPTLPFGGAWTYALAPEADGTRLTITEDGEVRNVMFRFLARFVFGHAATIEAYLAALGRRFGEDVVPSVQGAEKGPKY